MSAPRNPWIKLHVECLDHPKVALLSDGEFRTWITLLLKASQQAERWCFASEAHAAVVTGRARAHIRACAREGLLDVEPSGRLVIHDAEQWQRWSPIQVQNGVVNDSPTTHETPAIAPVIDTSTTREAPVNDPDTTLARATELRGQKEKEIPENLALASEVARTPEEVDPLAGWPDDEVSQGEAPDDVQQMPEYEDLPQPPTPDHVDPAADAKPKSRRKPVDEPFIDGLVAEFAARLGGEEAVRLSIERALNHRAVNRALDRRQYVRNWVRSDAQRRAEVPPTATGQHRPDFATKHARELAELRQGVEVI